MGGGTLIGLRDDAEDGNVANHHTESGEFSSQVSVRLG
jgi:hypothetical protein